MPDGRFYEPPALTPVPFVAFDKHLQRAMAPAVAERLAYDPKALMRQYGSPLYVVSEDRLRSDFRRFLKAFTRPDLDTRVAYSVKTNYLPAICAILKQEGAWAEVVSGMEFDLVRSLGFAGGEIIFNGPHKTRPELEAALASGALVVVDNFDELDLVEQIVGDRRASTKIGMRISFSYGGIGWTKFGFNCDNGDAQRAIGRIAKNEFLDLDLLHNHCGTFVLLHDLYARSAEKLVEIAKVARDNGLTPTKVDFGGGYPSRNNIKPEFDLPGGSRRHGNFWDAYGNVICRPIQKAKELFGGRPTIILEPGRAVVDACVDLLCSVVAHKEIPGQDTALIVDAGVNLVPTAVFYDHAVQPTAGPESGQPDEKLVDVFGPLCMQTDRLRTKVRLPQMNIGDALVVSNVGAYCHSQSMQFIQTRPATVLVGSKRQELVRRREDWRDVFALDAVPDRLRGDGFAF